MFPGPGARFFVGESIMKSRAKHCLRSRLPAAPRAAVVRLKVELLEHRLAPDSMFTGLVAGSSLGDIFDGVNRHTTADPVSDLSSNRMPAHRTSGAGDASTGFYHSTSSVALALVAAPGDLVRNVAQPAGSTGIGTLDDLGNQLENANADGAAASMLLARRHLNPSSAAVAGSPEATSPAGTADSTGSSPEHISVLPETPSASATPVVQHSVYPFGLGIRTGSGQPLGVSQDVLQHHRNSTRDGLYIDPLFTQDAAANTHRDLTFDASLPGSTYGQPLYIGEGPGGRPTLIVATEQNVVLALDASDGSQLWTSSLGTPVARAQLPCGDIDPLGVTGTPVIDPSSRTIFVDAMTTPDGGTTKQHLIYALSLDDGSVRDGWPVDVNAMVPGFNSTVQNQRGALLLNQGTLYVPYGGHFGDCGTYHGWVVAVPVDDPSSVTAFETDARGAGIWAPGGLSSDGNSVFAATGNAFGSTTWMGGEAILRLGPGGTFSGDPADYFTPSNWRQLDASDTDVGGSGPVLVDVPGADPSQLVVALGKNGVAYLLDRNYLGGVGTGDGFTGEGLQSMRVATGTIINAAAAYTTTSGTYVVFTTAGNGIGCPGTPGSLVGLRIGAAAPPTIEVAWCANNQGRGSPIVTTTDGSSVPIVWTAGAESSNRLHAFDGETGEVLYAGGGASELMSTVRRFSTPIAVNGRIFVAADNRLYAFTTQ